MVLSAHCSTSSVALGSVTYSEAGSTPSPRTPHTRPCLHQKTSASTSGNRCHSVPPPFCTTQSRVSSLCSQNSFIVAVCPSSQTTVCGSSSVDSCDFSHVATSFTLSLSFRLPRTLS